MAYSEFTIRSVKAQLGIRLIEDESLFDPTQLLPIAISDHLKTTLTEDAPVAIAINTEKSRSEWIIAPILSEVRKHAAKRISLFSGTTFTVDEAQGLNGQCDYILSLGQEQFYIAAPILAIVEAKKEDIIGGIGQCVATMFAAQLYNQQEQQPLPAIYGAVTTGTNWKFLKLSGTTAWVDRDEYYLNEIETLLGIFSLIISAGSQTQVTA